MTYACIVQKAADDWTQGTRSVFIDDEGARPRANKIIVGTLWAPRPIYSSGREIIPRTNQTQTEEPTMMSKATGKLSLKKELLRTLEEGDLRVVNGGKGYPSFFVE